MSARPYTAVKRTKCRESCVIDYTLYRGRGRAPYNSSTSKGRVGGFSLRLFTQALNAKVFMALMFKSVKYFMWYARL